MIRTPQRSRFPLPMAAVVAVCVLATGCSGDSAAATPPDGAVGPTLVFSDEFDGGALGSVWSTCYWWQVDGGCTIESNDEAQWYQPDAVEVRDGNVSLTASNDPQSTTDGGTLPFRSGMISTGPVDNDAESSGFEFTYGTVEARVKFPTGDGTWPAVWLLSADRTSLPEIDIVEWYGSRADTVTSHVHQRIDGERESARIDLVTSGIAGEWHVVEVDWSPDLVEFRLDGESMGTVDDPALIPSTPMYLIANLALGGPAGEVDVDELPQQLEIDWIRVWQ